MFAGRRYTPADIFFLLAKFKWLIAVLWVTVAVAAVLVGRMLPDRYRSESLIQVIPQRVPESLVRSTVTSRIDDRLPVISQQILSRTRLERIIQDFDLYPEERRTELMEDIVAKMRVDVVVNVVKGDAFQVSYASENPRTAMRVTERIASLFVEENLRDREILAEGANQFLDSQLDDARRRLLEHEKKLEDYRRQHTGELPSQLESNMQSIASMQSQVAQLAESINRDRDRRLILERQLGDVTAEVAISSQRAASPQSGAGDAQGTAAKQLETARDQLVAMELRLKATHPDIVRAKRIIAELERKAEAEAAQAPVSSVENARPASPAELQQRIRLRDLKSEIDSLDRQIANKDSEQRRLKATIPVFQGRVDVIPTRESELIALTRDYETLQSVYTNLLLKGQEAKVSANLKRRQIGEQFKILDVARLPERPFSPDRTLINIGGIVGGLVLALALIALMEVLDSSFRTDQDVIGMLALPVLATIPAILTRQERRTQERRKLLVAAASIFIVVCGCGVLVWKLDLLTRFL